MAPRRSHNAGRTANAAYRLPPELLVECLRAADPPTRVRASQVSRAWRNIALCDRRLWDSFSCSHFRDVQHQDAMFNKLQAMLLRSRSLPFTLRIPHGYHGTVVRYRLRVVCLEQLEVRRLVSYDGPRDIFSALIAERTPLPMLTSLNIREPTSNWALDLSGAYSGRTLPSLRVLQTDFVSFSPKSRPFLSLEHLTCSLEYDIDIVQLFQIFPDVVHLHINNVEPGMCFPHVLLPESLRSLELRPLRGRDIYLSWVLQNWEGVKLQQLVAHEAATAQGVLPLFLTVHPHPVELRLCGRSGEMVLAVLRDPDKATSELTWTITPSSTSLSTFLGGLRMSSCERLTSLSVAFEQLDRLFAAQLQFPGLEHLELGFHDAEKVPELRVCDEGYFICAPLLQRVIFTMDGRTDAVNARMDEILSALVLLSAAFRVLVTYDAELLESITLSAPLTCVQKLNFPHFSQWAKVYSVCATA